MLPSKMNMQSLVNVSGAVAKATVYVDLAASAVVDVTTLLLTISALASDTTLLVHASHSRPYAALVRMPCDVTTFDESTSADCSVTIDEPVVKSTATGY